MKAHSKRPDVLRVSDFAPIGDGVHDDAGAVERCEAAAAAARPRFGIKNASDSHPIYVTGPVVTLAPGETLLTNEVGQSYVVGVDGQRRKVTLPDSFTRRDRA